MKKQEQNDRHEKSATKVTNKRLTNRALRREAKRDPEDAEKKPRFLGYTG